MPSILIVNNTLIFLTIKMQMECGGMCLKEKHHPMASYGFVWKYGSPQIHWLIITLPIETAVWLEGISPCSDTSQNHIVGYGYHHHISMISYLLLVKSPCFRSTALGPRSSGHRQGCTLAPNLPWYQINDVILNSFTHSVYNNNMYIYIPLYIHVCYYLYLDITYQSRNAFPI